MRLNWDGRGERKAEPTGGRQTIFHADTLSADSDVPPKEAVKIEASVSLPNGVHYGARPSCQGHVAGQTSTHTTVKPSKNPVAQLATRGMEPPSLASSKEPFTDNISIDPVLTGQDTQQPCASPPFQYGDRKSVV